MTVSPTSTTSTTTSTTTTPTTDNGNSGPPPPAEGGKAAQPVQASWHVPPNNGASTNPSTDYSKDDDDDDDDDGDEAAALLVVRRPQAMVVTTPRHCKDENHHKATNDDNHNPSSTQRWCSAWLSGGGKASHSFWGVLFLAALLLATSLLDYGDRQSIATSSSTTTKGTTSSSTRQRPWLEQPSNTTTTTTTTTTFPRMIHPLSKAAQQMQGLPLQVPHHPRDTWRHLHLVFVGDLSLHWQYLSLVYLIHTGHWLDDWCPLRVPGQNTTASFCLATRERRSWADWMAFYDFSNSWFDGLEICDCVRTMDRDASDPKEAVNIDPVRFVENRYYWDPHRNISITYIAKYGFRPAQGRMLPPNTTTTTTTTTKPSFHVTTESVWGSPGVDNHDTSRHPPLAWAGDWTFVIKELIPTTLRPSYIILNAGHWEHDLNTNLLTSLWFGPDNNSHNATNSTTRLIYKKTNRRRDASLTDFVGPEEEFCFRATRQCLDVPRWRFNESLYMDDYHYQPLVYRLFNQELLRVLVDPRHGNPVPPQQQQQQQQPSSTTTTTTTKSEPPPLPSKNYNDDIDNDPTLSPLENLSIVFVGDSVTRYQYLELAYFVHTRGRLRLPDPVVSIPNLVFYYWSGNWTTYFRDSTDLFEGSMVCDCTRNDGGEAFENRYYIDGESHNMLLYLQKMGQLPNRGHVFLPNPATQLFFSHEWPGVAVNHFHPHQRDAPPPHHHRRRRLGETPNNHHHRRRLWETDWLGIITDVLADMVPRPKYFVMNAGAWKHDLTLEYVQRVRQALDKIGMIGIFKMTSKTTGNIDNSFVNGIEEYARCQAMHYCFSLSRALIPNDLHIDGQHFWPSVYRRWNEDLLDLIQNIEHGHVWPNPTD